METISGRLILVAAVAPLAWGTTYLVTETFLPPDRPLFGAAVRALPAGLVLLAVRRRAPSGVWWWRSLALGLANIGLFFPLIFLAAYRLPGGLAATVQATSPLAVMAIAWMLIGERPRVTRVLAALVGLTGVSLLVIRSPGALDPLGLAAAIGSVVTSALGFVLIKRWPAPVDLLTLVSWQLVAAGLLLTPLALVVEGAPPRIDATAAAGFLWIVVLGTIVAYTCWFHALSRMPAGAVALVGLLNPVTGTVLGVVVAGELFGWAQALGMALVVGGVVVGGVVSGPARRRPAATGTAAGTAEHVPAATPLSRPRP